MQNKLEENKTHVVLQAANTYTKPSLASKRVLRLVLLHIMHL